MRFYKLKNNMSNTLKLINKAKEEQAEMISNEINEIYQSLKASNEVVD
jgi:hypothetical protein